MAKGQTKKSRAKGKSKSKAESKALSKTDEPRQKCTARVKTCRKCGHRYEAGDKSWECPDCGTDRHCRNYAVYPYKVCRMHGAGAGRPPVHGKFTIPSRYADAFNRIRQDPELMSLSLNIALNETRLDELLKQLQELDTSAVHREIVNAVQQMEYDANRLANWLDRDDIRSRLPKEGFGGLFRGMVMLKQAVEPAYIQQKIWQEINFHQELDRRLNDTERRWATAHDQLVPISIALEAMRTVMRDALEFIVDPKDRAAFARRIRGYMGGES